MRYTLLLAVLLTSLVGSSVSMADTKEQSLDQMVAVVNDDLITRSELSTALKTVKLQLSQQNMQQPPERELEKQVLDQLINKRLQLQLAKQAGISVTEEELDTAVGKIAEQNGISVADLYKRLSAEGIAKSSYRKEIREQMTLTRIQQRQVAGKVKISPQEVSSFIESAKANLSSEKEYLLEDILVPISDSPSKQELASAEKRANSVLSKLRNGNKIATLVKKEAKKKNGLQSGDLGWRSTSELPSVFAKSVTSMSKNTFKGPIKAANGYHILKLKDVRTAEADSPQLADRKKVESMLLQRKFEQAVQNWVSQLRSQAFITTT